MFCNPLETGKKYNFAAVEAVAKVPLKSDVSAHEELSDIASFSLISCGILLLCLQCSAPHDAHLL